MLKRRSNINGFSLMELGLVILIISILFTLGALFMNESVDNHRYRATVREMEEIKKALIGDETILSGYERTDFGYVGLTRSFPGGLGALSGEFATNPGFSDDAWHNPYQYSNAGTVVIESWGADGGNGGTGLNSDVALRFTRNVYTNNTVYVTVHDIKGNILRGNTGPGDNFYHIQAVQLEHQPTLFTYAPVLTEASMFVFSGIPIGNFTVQVSIRNTNDLPL